MGPTLSGSPSGGGVEDEGAVAVDGGIEIEAAGGQERLAAARAVADGGHLAVGPGMRPEVGRGPAHVADQAVVGHPALARAVAAASSGLAPGASRKYRLGQMAR